MADGSGTGLVPVCTGGGRHPVWALVSSDWCLWRHTTTLTPVEMYFRTYGCIAAAAAGCGNTQSFSGRRI